VSPGIAVALGAWAHTLEKMYLKYPKSNILLSFVTILSALVIPQAADAVVFKYETCGAVMMGIGQAYNAGYDPEIHTSNVYQTLKDFRKTTLNHRSNDKWNYDSVLLSSEMENVDDFKTQVAERIRGIEKELEEGIETDFDQQRIAAGLQLRGIDAIRSFVAMRDEAIGKMAQDNQSHALNGWVGPATNFVFQTALTSVGIFYFDVTPWLAALIPFSVAIEALNSAKAWDQTSHEDNLAFMRVLENGSPDSWAYASMNSKVTWEFLKNWRNPEEMIERGKIEGIKTKFDHPPMAPLEIDQLLHFQSDAQGNPEPVLNVFVRFNTPMNPPPPSRPRGGRGKKIWEWLPQPQPQLVPIPALAPSRRR
jgi:hypothetical protein